MYASVALAAWRAVLEIRTKIQRTQPIYLMVAMVVLCALLYQEKTGGDLVYDHRVGMNTTAAAQHDP
jgi:uncharacterized membrane protein